MNRYATRVEIPDGDDGTEKTIELAGALAAGALADPDWPLWVRRKLITEPGTDPRDVAQVLQNAFDYVRSNVRYQFDPLALGNDRDTIADYVQSPHWTLFVEGMGDCLSHASLLGAMAIALGHGFAYRTIRADPTDPTRFSHVYALLGYRTPDGREVWVPADTSTPELGFGEEPANVARFSPKDFVIAPAA